MYFMKKQFLIGAMVLMSLGAVVSGCGANSRNGATDTTSMSSDTSTMPAVPVTPDTGRMDTTRMDTTKR